MNTTKITLALLALLCATAFAQQKGTFTDTRDKKKYKTVKIGKQTWMAENLNYEADSRDHFQCYSDSVANCAKYGRLYTFRTAFALACPAGWRLPAKDDWDVLVTAAGGAAAAGKALKAKAGWDSHEGKSGNGTDKFGFSALPGGQLNASRGEIYFGDIGTNAYWWSISEDGYGPAILNNNDSIKNYHLYGNYSVRCIQGKPSDEATALSAELLAEMKAEKAEKAKADSIAKAEAEVKAKAKAEQEAKIKADSIAREERIKTNSGTFTDSRDKRTYKTIKMGNQTWMAENLDYADKDSKCYDNKPENCKKYGRLYNGATAAKACPEGWHLPTKNEWATLVKGVGEGFAGFDLKSKSGWRNDRNGTDQYGFAALPGGYYINNAFKYVEEDGDWWSATEKDASKASFSSMSGLSKVIIAESDKNVLYSVRCLQGKAAAQPASQPAAKPAAQPQQQAANENCSVTFPKKACVSVPKNSCKLMGGKVVDKCP
jgi:uncharacterized protein (TIGR02145 family)